jgi:hypothetical protein
MSVFAEKERLVALNEQFAEAFREMGFSMKVTAKVQGFPIRCYRRKASQDRPVIYLSAGIHGDEPAGPLALMELLRSGAFDERASWLVCPILNPTGLIAGTRENHAGIDLNRGYLDAVSAETKGHVAWLENQGPINLSISLHEDYESTGFYLYEINCIDCPSYAHAVLQTVRAFFPPEPASVIDGHKVREPGWIFHEPEADLPRQWPEAIWLAKNGTAVSYTFETPSSKPLAARIAAQVQASRRLVALACEDH